MGVSSGYVDRFLSLYRHVIDTLRSDSLGHNPHGLRNVYHQTLRELYPSPAPILRSNIPRHVDAVLENVAQRRRNRCHDNEYVWKAASGEDESCRFVSGEGKVWTGELCEGYDEDQ